MAILAAPSIEGCSLCAGECSGVLDASGWGDDPINNRKYLINSVTFI